MNYFGSGPVPSLAVDESLYLAASQGSGAYPVFEEHRPVMKMNRIKSKTPVFAQTATSTIPTTSNKCLRQ